MLFIGILVLILAILFGAVCFEHCRSPLRKRAHQLLREFDTARKLHGQMEIEMTRATRGLTDALKCHVEAIESQVLQNTPVAFVKKFGSGFSVSPLESAGIGSMLQLTQFGLGRLEQVKGVGPTTAARIRQAANGAMADLHQNQIDLRPCMPSRTPAESSLIRQTYLQMCAELHIRAASDQLAKALAAGVQAESVVRKFSRITGWLVGKKKAREAADALAASAGPSGPVAAAARQATVEFSRWRGSVASAGSANFVENDFLNRKTLYWEFLDRSLAVGKDDRLGHFSSQEVRSPVSRGRDSGRTTESATPSARKSSSRPAEFNGRGAVGGRQQVSRLTWHPANHSFSHAGLDVGCGMIYTAAEPPEWPGEPSAIIASLSVAGSPADPSEDTGYYPSYQQMTPQQRRCYLEWLASGRDDREPQRRALGYVFTCFYGFERRMLVDSDRDPSLLEELMRLLRVYGKASGSRALHGYALELLHFAGWQLGTEQYRALWPRFLHLDEERPTHAGMHFVLANLFQRGEPLDWSVAYRIAMDSEESRRSNIVARSGDKFWQLFEQRYRERFPEGLVLQEAKRQMAARYRPASKALLDMQDTRGGGGPFELRIPNVAGIHRQFRDLPRIWNSCVEDLAGYSRVLGSRKQGTEAALATWRALPDNLRRPDEHPLKMAFDQMLGTAPHEGGHAFVTAGVLASLLGIGERARLTSSQSGEIAELAHELGWQVAPHPALTGLPFAWGQEIALYAPDTATADSPQLPGILRLLYLAVIIAASDGTIMAGELEAFRRFVAGNHKPESDAGMLAATEAALCRDANVALRSLPRIVKFVPASNRKTVLRALAHIAAADNQVTNDEVRTLQRIARAFGTEAGWIEQLLGEDAGFREVRVAGRVERSAGESIPARPGENQPSFRLDADRIKALTEETNEVISLLSSVMAEPEETPASQSNSEATTDGPDSASVDWLTGLDPRCHAPLLMLAQHDEITTDDFDGIAEKHHLMPDDLFDTVNTWADEVLGDFLLERGENIRVYRSLLPDRAELPFAA